MRFQLPTLFTSRVWEIARIDAHQGWDLCFRTYNRRPRDAKIFLHCRYHNLREVQRLIQNGEASLLDADEDGHNAQFVGNTNLRLSLLVKQVPLYFLPRRNRMAITSGREAIWRRVDTMVDLLSPLWTH